MDLVVLLIVTATLGFAGWLIYLGFKSKEFREVVEDVKEEIEEIEEFIDNLPTPAEVKKLTKAKLVELAAELGIEIDSKKKKADIVEEIEKTRK
jgi:cell division protein FtsL